MEKILIDKDKQLNAGDRVELHFITTGMVWITAAQIALIESRLEGRKDFTILSHSLPSNNRVIFSVQVLKTNPVIVTAAVIGAAIIGAGIVAWLTLDKVYQIMESPTGKAVIGSTAVGVLTIALLALLGLSKK